MTTEGAGEDLEWLEAALAPDEGWTRLPPYGGPTEHEAAFVPSRAIDDRLCLRLYRREEDGRLVGKAWFGPAAEGPPGHVHGGALMAVADHVIGAAVWLAGHPSFTARLEYDFKGMVRVGSVVVVEGWVDSVQGRKIRAAARMLSGDGQLLGEAQALFLRMERQHVETLARHLGSRPSA